MRTAGARPPAASAPGDRPRRAWPAGSAMRSWRISISTWGMAAALAMDGNGVVGEIAHGIGLVVADGETAFGLQQRLQRMGEARHRGCRARRSARAARHP